jgi:cell division ATPase FtsA
MSDTLRIAAFDIGTNKIVGAVSEKTSDDRLSIIAIEEEKTRNGSMYRGRINNVNDVLFHIVSIIKKLQNKTNSKIHTIYLSISNEKGYDTDEWKKLEEELESRNIKVYKLDRLDCMADTLMSNAEKEIGCLLIDFGGACTSFILRNKNAADVRGTIALGGNNITKDLTFLNRKYEDAEKLKIKLGTTKPEKLLRPNARIILEKSTNVNEAKFTTPLKLSEMIQDRVKDICLRFLDPMKKHEEFSKPGRSVILVGGGSYLNDLPEWISDETGLSVKIEDKFSFADSPIDININNAKYACLISLLNNGTEDCRIKDENLKNKKAKKTTTNRFVKIIHKSMDAIFGDEQYN